MGIPNYTKKIINKIPRMSYKIINWDFCFLSKILNLLYKLLRIKKFNNNRSF